MRGLSYHSNPLLVNRNKKEQTGSFEGLGVSLFQRKEKTKLEKFKEMLITGYKLGVLLFYFPFHFPFRRPKSTQSINSASTFIHRMSRSRVGGWVLSFGFVLRGITAE